MVTYVAHAIHLTIVLAFVARSDLFGCPVGNRGGCPISHRIGQLVVYLIAYGSAEIVLGYMEIRVFAEVNLGHLVVDRFTGLLIEGRSINAYGVCVEVLQLTRFAVLSEIGLNQIK